MINLLILACALLAAFRMTAPVLRMAIRMVAKLMGLTLFTAVAILCVIALLTHGVFI
jgi:hypothetical protein